MIAVLIRFVIGTVVGRWLIGSIEGEVNLPKSGGYIVVANHASYLDHFIVATVIAKARHEMVYFVTKKEAFERPISRWWHLTLGCIPINRSVADSQAFRTITEYLKAGKVVCLYPEGTRTTTGFLQEGKEGSVLFSALTRVPIVPMGTFGTFDIMPKHRRWPRRHRANVRIGNPIEVPELPRRPRDQFLAHYNTLIMDALRELSNELSLPPEIAVAVCDSVERQIQAASYWNDAAIHGGAKFDRWNSKTLHLRAKYICEELANSRYESADLYFELGRAIGRIGMESRGLFKLIAIKQARTCFRMALNLEPCHAHSLYAIGLWYQSVPPWLGGNEKLALRSFEDAVRADPANISLLMGLGRAQLHARDRGGALESFVMVMRINAKTGHDVRRQIEALGLFLRLNPLEDGVAVNLAATLAQSMADYELVSD